MPAGFSQIILPNLNAPLGPTGGVTSYTGGRIRRRERPSGCPPLSPGIFVDAMWIHLRSGWSLEIGTGYKINNQASSPVCAQHYGGFYNASGSQSLFKLPIKKFGDHTFQIAKETQVQWVWRIDGKAMATWQYDEADAYQISTGLEVPSQPTVPIPCARTRGMKFRDQNGRWVDWSRIYRTINVTNASFYGKYDSARKEWVTAYTTRGNPASLCSGSMQSS